MLPFVHFFGLMVLLVFLSSCASKATRALGTLPETSTLSVEELLQKAATSDTEDTHALQLAAANTAYQQKQFARAADIMQKIVLNGLTPAQKIYALTLDAELAVQNRQPQNALALLQNPSFQYLGKLPAAQQIRSAEVKAQALQTEHQLLAAVQERVRVAPLMSDSLALANQEKIWALANQLSDAQLQTGKDPDLSGWFVLVQIIRSNKVLAAQQSALQEWLAAHPKHPAAKNLPQGLAQISTLSSPVIRKVALVLPEQGPLANVANALRQGFMAAHYAALHGQETTPEIVFYGSDSITSLAAFYQQALQEGVDLVVGPLEKPLVRQLSLSSQLPIRTLALNYGDTAQTHPPQLFQFGLSAEDEARAVAARAWADGQRRAIALVPSGDWGDRTLAAFQSSWTAQGGTLIAAEHVERPVALAQQIAELFQLRESEVRAQRLESVLGVEVAATPTRRQDIDFIFLAASSQQAQQIKPTLAFQYAGDLPVYATSHVLANPINQSQPSDLNGIMFCETPWLLNINALLQQQVVAQWPEAAGSLGRLFAMGNDAYLLMYHLNQLQQIPEHQLQGLSGLLSLNATQQVVRQLGWAAFTDGSIQPLE